MRDLTMSVFTQHIFKQGQKRTGKIALLLMTLIAILAFSFGNRMTTMAQDRGNSWAGTVTSASGDPINATVNINGVQVEADGNGKFELQVSRPEDGRYVINVDKLGHVPISLIHVGSAMQDMTLQLQDPQRFEISPREPIRVEDRRGTQISIEPGSLVDSDGNPAQRPIQLLMYTYDLTTEEMVGDMSGINGDGELVALESAGAFFAEFIDEDGNKYNLAEGAEARIAIPADRTADFPGKMPLWSYDAKSGLWIEESQAVLEGEQYVGMVSHFSFWNFDVEKRAPACVRVTVNFSALPAGSTRQVKAKLLSPTRVRYLNLTQTENVLYNLPAYTNVEFYEPVNAPTPFATVNTGAPWGGSWGAPPYPYNACNGRVIISPATATPPPPPTSTPTPPSSDLGDAPDSTNNFGAPMTTLSGVPANYPVVFNDPFGIPGPIHWNSLADAWLGRSVDGELDADLPPGVPTNIDPLSNLANQDDLPGTTGILAPTFALPACGMTTFQYEVTVVGPPQPRYTNAWIDFNDDGDWEDSFPCGGGVWVNEWIIANQMTTLGPGVYTLTTPAFGAMTPGSGRPVWMRLMLSEAPTVNVPVPSGADGRGPLGGYDFGETEDYLTDGINIRP